MVHSHQRQWGIKMVPDEQNHNADTPDKMEQFKLLDVIYHWQTCYLSIQ